MERTELVKSIEACVERALDDFAEALQYLKTGGSDKCDEAQSLVFASRRMVDLVDCVLEMHHCLVRLKYLTTDVQRPEADRRRDGGGLLDKLFEELNLRLGV